MANVWYLLGVCLFSRTQPIECGEINGIFIKSKGDKVFKLRHPQMFLLLSGYWIFEKNEPVFSAHQVECAIMNLVIASSVRFVLFHSLIITWNHFPDHSFRIQPSWLFCSCTNLAFMVTWNVLYNYDSYDWPMTHPFQRKEQGTKCFTDTPRNSASPYKVKIFNSRWTQSPKLVWISLVSF